MEKKNTWYNPFGKYNLQQDWAGKIQLLILTRESAGPADTSWFGHLSNVYGQP